MRAIWLATVLTFLASPAFACGRPAPNADIHKISKSHPGKKIALSRCGGRLMKIKGSGKV